MLGPCFVHASSVLGPSLVRAWSLLGPCLAHAWSVLGPCLFHVWSMFVLCLVHAWSMFPLIQLRELLCWAQFVRAVLRSKRKSAPRGLGQLRGVPCGVCSSVRMRNRYTRAMPNFVAVHFHWGDLDGGSTYESPCQQAILTRGRCLLTSDLSHSEGDAQSFFLRGRSSSLCKHRAQISPIHLRRLLYESNAQRGMK